jgi:hypothetical protein
MSDALSECENPTCSATFHDCCDHCGKSFCIHCMTDHNCPSGPSSSTAPSVVHAVISESNTINSYFRGVGNAPTTSSSTVSATSSRAIVDKSLSAPVQNRAAFDRKRKAASEVLLAENAMKTAKFSPGDLVIPAARYPLTVMGPSVNRSFTWNHFKIITVKDGADYVRNWAETHASCKICHSKALLDATVKWAVPFTIQRSPGHLQRHLKQFQNEIMVEKRIALAVECITSFYKKHPDFEETYLKWAVHTFQPLNTIEGERYRAMCKSLSLDAPEMTANKVMNSLLQIEQDIKQQFRKKLEGQYISMTLDHWTSGNKVAFVAPTAHFVDADYRLQRCTLACTVHSGGSSGDESKIVSIQKHY